MASDKPLIWFHFRRLFLWFFCFVIASFLWSIVELLFARH